MYDMWDMGYPVLKGPNYVVSTEAHKISENVQQTEKAETKYAQPVCAFEG